MLSAFVQTVSDGCSVDSETPEDFENATLASYTFWFQLLGLFPQETKNYPGKRPKQCGGQKDTRLVAVMMMMMMMMMMTMMMMMMMMMMATHR